MTKEQAYDERINPLMAQIIAICAEHKIAHVASFALGEDEDGDELMCTSVNVTDEREPPDELRAAANVLLGRRSAALTLTTTSADGSKRVETIL